MLRAELPSILQVLRESEEFTLSGKHRSCADLDVGHRQTLYILQSGLA